MRRRFPISTHLEFKDAKSAKEAKEAEVPTGSYQIRKYKNGFRLVERLTTSEAKVVEGMRKPKKHKGSTYVSI